ncbi:MAG: hypothetical protein LBS83_00810 [Holosporales bacterium]|jgi:hypothetical protein|nr:hypothetical protein [Holosporales bacterium]
MVEKILQSFKLPGCKPIIIPIVGRKRENELNGVSKATQDCRVTFEFQCGCEIYTQLFGWSCGLSRENIGNPMTNFFPASATHASELCIIIQVSNLFPKLEQAMNSGSIFPRIIIRKFGWILGQDGSTLDGYEENPTGTPLETIVFFTCFITYIQQVLDYIVLRIRYCQVDDRLNIYNQEGAALGSISGSVSLINGEMEYKSDSGEVDDKDEEPEYESI